MDEFNEEDKEALLKDYILEVVEGFQEAIHMFGEVDEIECDFEVNGEKYTLTVKKQ